MLWRNQDEIDYAVVINHRVIFHSL